MTRSIIVIAIVGIAAALICLPLAAMLYRHGNHLESWTWSGYQGWFGEDDDDDDSDARDQGGERGRIESRDFAWGTADRLELDVTCRSAGRGACWTAYASVTAAWLSVDRTTVIPDRSRSSCRVRRCMTSPSTGRASWSWITCSRMH